MLEKEEQRDAHHPYGTKRDCSKWVGRAVLSNYVCGENEDRKHDDAEGKDNVPDAVLVHVGKLAELIFIGQLVLLRCVGLRKVGWSGRDAQRRASGAPACGRPLQALVSALRVQDRLYAGCREK